MFVQCRKRRFVGIEPLADAVRAVKVSKPSTATPGPLSSDELETSAPAAATAAVEIEVESNRSATTPQARPARSIFGAKKSHPCRVCGLLLSSASNRLRHERAKHHTQVTGKVAVPVPQQTQPRSVHEAHSLREGPGGRHESIILLDVSDEHTTTVESRPNSEDNQSTDSDVEMTPVNDVDETDSDRAPSLQQSLTAQDQVVFVEESTDSNSNPSLLDLEGAQPLLQEEELQANCVHFLRWLTQPPLTQCEALVKARRIKSLTQLQPIKTNLRFIFVLLYEKRLIRQVDLKCLKLLSVCQALFDIMSERQVGSGRFHAIFLLLKKILVYLASQESTLRRQFLQPTIFESYFYVDGVCSDSSSRRKQEARNRAVLGAHAGQVLARQQPRQPPQPFVVPDTWSPSSAAVSDKDVHRRKSRSPPGSAMTSEAGSSSGQAKVTAAEMSKQELQLVTKACITYLAEHCLSEPGNGTAAAAAAAPSPAELNSDRTYMAYLVTAILCLGLAPRSQVLQKLRIGSSFVKEADGRYWVKILAEQSKNGKPTTFSIAEQLTTALDYYIDVIRPRLLYNLTLTESSMSHDYLFVKRNGSAPRTDFSSCTTMVTQQHIGRPINAHAFRAAVITTYYEAGASQSEMDTLASIMAHDPVTARNFYFRPQFGQAAVLANDKMTHLLLNSSLDAHDA